MEREASARAWRFLRYNQLAKWTAILAGMATSVLFVALLVVLGLFLELLVYQGRIPSYRDLPRWRQEALAEQWDRLSPEDRQSKLRNLGLAPGAAPSPLTSSPFRELLPGEQSLVWRGEVFRILNDRVGGNAAARVLPSYWELPPRWREAFADRWRAFQDTDAMGVLTDLGLQEWPKDLPQAWAVFLYSQYQAEGAMPSAGLIHLREWATGILADESGRAASETTLADRGALTLVVRSEGRPYGRLASWFVRQNAWMWRGGNAGYLTGLFVLAVLLCAVRGLLMFLMATAAARATTEAATRLRRAVYHHTFRLGTLAFRPTGPNEAVSVFTRHLEAVHAALYTRLTVLFREPVKVLLILVFALAVHPWLGLAFLFFALLVWLVTGQAASWFRRQGRLAARRAADQLALIQESLLLMRMVKIYLMELFNQSRVERQLARLARAQQRRYLEDAVAGPLLVFLGSVAAVILLGVSGWLVLTERVGVVSIIVLATAMVSLYWPLTNFLRHGRVLRRGRASAVALFKFLDRPSEVAQVVGAEFLPPLRNQLEFVGVHLKEPVTNRSLLRNVNLTVLAGQRVGIVGPDETEKHALVYLIPRLLDPTSGEIRIDDHNLRWVTLDSLRAQIGMVMQNSLIFNDTVANNIGCGDPSYTLPQIIEAAKIAHAHQFIQKLPQGYETHIGSLGHSLPLGIQFLVAIARAILRDPALFIIEEPVTPLDDDIKALLDDTFSRVLTQRTTIFLPHRPTTIRSCDRIFLLHKGRIEATGAHRELLEENELYRHLHYIEFNELAEQI